MEQQASGNPIESALAHSWRVRLALALLTLGVFCLTNYTGFPTRAYWLRVSIACLCMGAFGLLCGFAPQPEDSGTQRSQLLSMVLLPLGLVITASTHLAGLYRHPADQRYALMLKPHYLVPAVLFISACFLCSIAGGVLFRRLHPDQAFLRPLEEEKPPAEQATAATRIIRLCVVVLVVWFLSFLLLRSFFPAYRLRIMLISVFVLFAMQSLLAGHLWPQMGSRRRLWYSLAVIGPPAGFFGAYGAAKTHDIVHLLRAIWFAGWIAAAWVLPLVLYRIFANLRGRRHTGPVV